MLFCILLNYFLWLRVSIIFPLRDCITVQLVNYLKYFHDFCWKLHESGVSDSPVNPIDEYTRSDSVSDRPEFRFLIGLPPGGSELSGESRGQPLAHFRWHGIRLHLGQLVIFVRQSSTGNRRTRALEYRRNALDKSTRSKRLPSLRSNIEPGRSMSP